MPRLMRHYKYKKCSQLKKPRQPSDVIFNFKHDLPSYTYLGITTNSDKTKLFRLSLIL